jgi:hypothetical protein
MESGIDKNIYIKVNLKVDLTKNAWRSVIKDLTETIQWKIYTAARCHAFHIANGKYEGCYLQATVKTDKSVDEIEELLNLPALKHKNVKTLQILDAVEWNSIEKHNFFRQLHDEYLD